MKQKHQIILCYSFNNLKLLLKKKIIKETPSSDQVTNEFYQSGIQGGNTSKINFIESNAKFDTKKKITALEKQLVTY